MECVTRAGHDQVPSNILKKCAVAIGYPLTTVFNESLVCGEFPSNWKISHITPIFKSGSRKRISDYRGIAILPTVGQTIRVNYH